MCQSQNTFIHLSYNHNITPFPDNIKADFDKQKDISGEGEVFDEFH
jgi:hypothetical protein